MGLPPPFKITVAVQKLDAMLTSHDPCGNILGEIES